MDPAASVASEGNDIYRKITDLFKNTNDIIWIYDLNSETIYFSRMFDELPDGGDKPGACSASEFRSMIHLRDRKLFDAQLMDILTGHTQEMAIEVRMAGNGSNPRWVLLKGGIAGDIGGDPGRSHILTGTLTDVDEKRKKENKLNYMSFYDTLTGLPNRSMFTYRTSVTINQRRKESAQCAVVYIGIDNFKLINDIYGHYMGDDVLAETARLISLSITQSEMLARHGGDEFLLLYRRISSLDALEKNVVKFLKAINKPMIVQGNEIKLTYSAGIAVFPANGVTSEELVRNAEIAMHKAKVDGKNRHCIFDQSINTAILKRSEMEKELGLALERRELFLEYQPLVNANSGRIECAEALLRWKSPVYGNVPPMDFIPLAEESGLILPIGAWVLQQACKDCSGWQKLGSARIPVSVNISSLQMKNRDFMTDLDDILANTPLEPQLLQLELTESVFVDNVTNVSATLQKLRDKGVKVALDDFGTGYSSLNYLKCLPLDVLKVDKTFIKDLRKNETEKAIASTIISLAHILNLLVVAEGVETEQQFEYLKSIGCNIIQGYLLSKPIDNAAFMKFIREFKYPQP